MANDKPKKKPHGLGKGRLNILGAEGWELVAIHTCPIWPHNAHPIFYLKRPKGNGWEYKLIVM